MVHFPLAISKGNIFGTCFFVTAAMGYSNGINKNHEYTVVGGKHL